MSLHLTPEMIETTYELLRATPPYRGWKLPPVDEVQFDIMEEATHCADYIFSRGTHRIRVNNMSVGTLARLIHYMAHEMVHLYTVPFEPEEHGVKFRRAAKQVCRFHGFSFKEFMCGG